MDEPAKVKGKVFGFSAIAIAAFVLFSLVPRGEADEGTVSSRPKGYLTGGIRPHRPFLLTGKVQLR